MIAAGVIAAGVIAAGVIAAGVIAAGGVSAVVAGAIVVGVGDELRVDGTVGGAPSSWGEADRRSCSRERRGARAESGPREGPALESAGRRALKPPSSVDSRRGGVAPPVVDAGEPGVAGDVGVGARSSRSSAIAPVLVVSGGKPAGGVVMVMGAVLQ
ncbi:hypothetical protein [Mitsuaria sp. CC2]|uniref:hypothetical protein n=1 Tax=Mitsuaria sp. CC2 TaxID=3029186 RepID=UPI003BA21052